MFFGGVIDAQAQTPDSGLPPPDAVIRYVPPDRVSSPSPPLTPKVPPHAPVVEVIPPSAPVSPTLAPPLPVPDADTGPPPEQKDEFIAALSHVYATQPQLKAQREAQKALDETVAQAISGFRPEIIAGYDVSRDRTTGDDDRWEYENSHQKTLTVEQPLFSGGGTFANFQTARERIRAGRAQLTAVEQQVLFAAVVAYTDVVEKQSVLEVNQNNVDVLRKQLEATQARYEVGELTRTDVAQSQARLAIAMTGERQALGDLESSRATFRRVVGYDAPQQVALPPEPESLLPQHVEQAVEWSQVNEPTLLAARYLEEAADSAINQQVSTLLPSASVQATASRGNDPIPGLGRGHNDSLRLNISIPLYQSGAEWSRLREARYLAQQAKFTMFDTRDSVVENATRAWQDYQTAKAVIASNEEAVKAAEEALEGIHQEALYGTRTILDLLDTEQEVFNAQLELVRARVAEKQQAYRLLAAVGRLTARELQLPVDLHDPKKHYDDVKYQLIGL